MPALRRSPAALQCVTESSAFPARDQVAAEVELEPFALVGREDAAERSVLLDHERVEPGVRQQGRGDRAADSCADDDRVVGRAATSFARRRTREEIAR